MRAHLVLLCLLATAFTLSVKGKPHGKHHTLSKSSHTAKEKDVIPEEANEGQVLPTFMTFEASSQEQEDEDVSSEDNANVNTKVDGGLQGTGGGKETAPVLLSEEELADLLKEESDEEEAEEEGEEVGKGEEEREEQKDEEAPETEEDEEDDVEAEEVSEREDEDKEEVEVEALNEERQVAAESEEKEVEVLGVPGSKGETEAEEADGSTGSELPVDLDYAGDSDISQPLPTESAAAKPHADDDHLPTREDLDSQEKVELTGEKQLLTATDDYDQDVQNTEAAESEEALDQVNLSVGSKEQGKGSQDEPQEESEGDREPKSGSDLPEPKSRVELDRAMVAGKGEGEEEEEKSKNTNASLTKRKTKKQKKNQRVRKHPPQRDEAQPGLGQSPQEPPESESRAVLKAKRRRAGKWAPLVGMNPVQIRATVDLYPSARPSLGGSTHRPEALADPCDNFRCKRGRTCKLNEDNKPACVCQEPSECPPSVNTFDHVCGTDNNTYDTSCELFATKCNLEGTKKGHRLHLDYTGPCKFIAPCQDTELVQFPLRMRDWLKNVLLQLYEHDSKSPGFLTPKQRVRVRKIFESERRLHAGDHPIELLAMDFEKNYNMYIYPVHWQFAQMDQHPSDRFLTHSELAPLRVPLVPMEHCTSRFFMECDADKDKLVSFREWAQCFGIKEEDMNVNLLF